jgi:competence protein ComEA
VAFVILLSLAAMGGYSVYQWRLHGGLIEIDEKEKQPIAFRVDVNKADWPELTLLPGVGESLAKGIVESRERNGPFRRPEDLRRVYGIGPKTLEKIRPYLLPIADPEGVAGNSP